MKLSKNFSKSEFDSKDGSTMPAEVLSNVKQLANNLQVLRDFVGVPIEVNSCYRSPAHNKAVGGAKNSQHLTGKGADIFIEGVNPELVAFVIERFIRTNRMSEGGLKAYNTFTHYDIRGTKARW